MQRNRRGSTQLDIDNDYVADGAPTADDDDEPEAEAPAAGAGVQPAILTSPLAVDTAEGTTVNLPCRVTQGSRKYTFLSKYENVFRPTDRRRGGHPAKYYNNRGLGSLEG